MDKLLRALVATACVVVIGLGAHYGVREYEASARAAKEGSRTHYDSKKLAKAEIFRIAGANPDERQKVRDACRAFTVTMRSPKAEDRPGLAAILAWACIELGYL